MNLVQRGYFVDSELLVLLVAGRTNRRIIRRHRRLTAYSAQDFDQFGVIIADRGGIVWVTPNTLTEASNLLGQHGNPERELPFRTLASLISECREVLVDSRRASINARFSQLGLADAALLEVISADRPLVTVDGRLYAAALAANPQSATDFNHLRTTELVS